MKVHGYHNLNAAFLGLLRDNFKRYPYIVQRFCGDVNPLYCGRRRYMGHDQRFALLFPTVSRAFSLGVPSGREWEELTRSGKSLVWRIVLTSEDLLAYAASYRQPDDMFCRVKFWMRLDELRENICIMATKRKADPVKDSDKAEWVGFLDFRLTDAQIETLDEWKPKPVEVWEGVDLLIQGGRRLTLSYNKQTRLASCTIIDDDPARATGGYALSSQDQDGALALKMALYKHAVLLEGDWSQLIGHTVRSRRG